MNDYFRIFKNIENNLKEMNNNWFIDSFINGDEMRIKIKEIDKYYFISITFDLIMRDNTIDLSAKIKYELNNGAYRIFTQRATASINKIYFDIRNEIGAEGGSYHDYTSLYMESEFDTKIDNIEFNNIINVINDVVKATKEHNFIINTIKNFE